MPQFASLPSLAARTRRLRDYRLLVNTFAPLLTIVLAVLVFRWVFPWVFSVLIYVWAAAALLLVVFAVPWLLVWCAFALGRIKCPACEAPFASRFRLWIPKTCQSCGYDVTASKKRATSNGSGRGT
jgi:protein-S-isoprenylcysteine O-methyltransferase Ste14